MDEILKETRKHCVSYPCDAEAEYFDEDGYGYCEGHWDVVDEDDDSNEVMLDEIERSHSSEESEPLEE